MGIWVPQRKNPNKTSSLKTSRRVLRRLTPSRRTGPLPFVEDIRAENPSPETRAISLIIPPTTKVATMAVTKVVTEGEEAIEGDRIEEATAVEVKTNLYKTSLSKTQNPPPGKS